MSCSCTSIFAMIPWDSRHLRWSQGVVRDIFSESKLRLLKINLEYVLTLRPLLAAKNLLPPISLRVLTLTLKNYLKQPSGTTFNGLIIDRATQRSWNIMHVDLFVFLFALSQFLCVCLCECLCYLCQLLGP